MHALVVTGDAAFGGELKAVPGVVWTIVRTMDEGLRVIRGGKIDIALLELTPATDATLVRRLCEAIPRMPFVSIVADEALGAAAARDGAIDMLVRGRLEPRELPRFLAGAAERHRTRTDLANSTRMLRVSQTNYKRLITASADGMVIIGRDGKVRFANPAAARLLGSTPEDLEGLKFPFPADAGRITELDLGDDRVAEMTVVETEWLGDAARLASMRDITERQKLHLSLEQANAKLRELDQIKSTFLSKISHELRTPVATIKGFVDNLLDGVQGDIPDAQRPSIERIHANVARLQALIEDLLEMVGYEMGSVALDVKPVPIRRLMEEVNLDYVTKAMAAGIDLRVELPDTAAEIPADRERLRQAFDNLLNNAMKFTPRGGSIRVAVAEEPGGDAVVFTVADSGPGIPEAEQLRVFDRFYQIARPDQAAPQGSGLGLTICREILDLHHGTIWVESKPGEGARFRFRLPTQSSHAPRRVRVLVVDDDAAARRTLELSLKRARVPTEIVAAANGKDALAKMEPEPAHVVFTDVRMPVMDGVELLAAIKHRWPGVPVVVVTAFRDQYHAQEMLEAGAAGYLARPFSPESVLEVFDRVREAAT